MSTSTLGLFLRHLALSEEVNRLGTSGDHDLLAAHESGRGQAAFAELMRRYGPMVLRTCRRVLGRGPDAEDAFQATFVFLARKAGSISKREALGGWLHRVAYCTALNVLTGEIRRRAHERQAGAMTYPDPDPSAEASWNEVRPILDAELNALPEQARQLLIACYLQGKTHAEAAAELGLPPGSLARHLDRARALLATRLARRGVTVSAGLLAALLGDLASGAAVPAVLLVHTLEAARTFNEQASGAVSAHVASLVEGASAGMAKSSTKFGVILACCLGLAGAALVACRVPSARPDEPAVVGLAAVQATGQPGAAARVDCYGDPLPAGALARMGTVRMWHRQNRREVPWSFGALAFSPDGKILIAQDQNQLRPVYLWDAATGKEIRRLTDTGRLVSLSPDGRTLVTVDADRTVYRWEVATGKLLSKQEYQGPKGKDKYSKVFFLPGGKILGWADFRQGDDRARWGGMSVWDAATGKEIRQLSGPMKRAGLFAAVAFSPDGKLLATADVKREKDANKIIINQMIIRLWEVATGKEIRQLTGGHIQVVKMMAFSRDGKTLASAAADGKICVWEVATGKKIHLLDAEDAHHAPLTFSLDGKTLVGGKTGHLWDVGTGKVIRSFDWTELDGENVRVAAFSPDGKILATGEPERVIRLWEVATGREISPRKGHQGAVNSVAYSPDGKTLVSGSDDRTVLLWEVATGKEIRRSPRHEVWGVCSIAYSPDGKTLASSDVGICYLWEAATGKKICQFQNPRPVNVFSPDSKILATGKEMGRRLAVSLWDVATRKEIYSLPTGQEGNGFWSCAFSSDGRILAATGKHDTVGLWEVVTGKPIGQLHLGEQKQNEPGRRWVQSFAFSPDGRILAGAMERDTASLWDVASCKKIHQLEGSGARKGWGDNLDWSFTFSPDGRILATAGGEDRKVHLWEVVTGKEIGQLTGHQSAVRCVAFSPDGKTLASGSEDTTCLIWDVTSFAGRLKPVLAPPLAPRALSKEQLEAAWTDLAKDPAKAYKAIWALQATPAQAIPLLQARVRPVAPLAGPRQFQHWIADLDDNSFTVRDKAQREIAKLGEAAVPALRQALKGRPGLEMKRRLQDLLAELEPKVVVISPERLREVRAVQVLESVGTAKPRQVLQAWAKGVPGARLTVEAEAALARLAKRSPAGP